MAGLIGLARSHHDIRRQGRWLVDSRSVLVSAGNAVVRKAFEIPSNAWLELQWYLFGAAFLLAAAYTLRQNEHIRIDILYNMYPRRRQLWVDLFGHVFFLMPFAPAFLKNVRRSMKSNLQLHIYGNT